MRRETWQNSGKALELSDLVPRRTLRDERTATQKLPAVAVRKFRLPGLPKTHERSPTEHPARQSAQRYGVTDQYVRIGHLAHACRIRCTAFDPSCRVTKSPWRRVSTPRLPPCHHRQPRCQTWRSRLERSQWSDVARPPRLAAVYRLSSPVALSKSSYRRSDPFATPSAENCRASHPVAPMDSPLGACQYENSSLKGISRNAEDGRFARVSGKT